MQSLTATFNIRRVNDVPSLKHQILAGNVLFGGYARLVEQGRQKLTADVYLQDPSLTV
jgi:hypothetical protein